MSCIFKISNVTEPMKWYIENLNASGEWEYDEILKQYRLDTIYLTVKEQAALFEDGGNQAFFGWDTSAWLALAGDNELVYSCYSEDTLEAEFIHIVQGTCVREFREYGGEIDTDEGTLPAFESWVDVASYADEHLR